ncbi:MAG: tRNA (guanine(46)-N(7))-methyltransferase TrmB [Alphaproteobacteria bacterium]|nr:tRNA (guanine(46)-N(7))-methyltransferase TrmB [Alphaproteobacteria bacterium]
MTESKDKKVRRVFGRRMGRPMHKARLDVLDTILPQKKIAEELLTENRDKSPADLFGHPVDKLHFEIGFGSGEHLHYIMGQFPDDHFIGAEPYINGMTSFLKEFKEPVPENFRVHMDDALMVLNSLEDASVDFLYILNPDPWPKSRHHKRRIVSADNLEVFARVMKDGGVMLQTTDVDELAEWMVTQTVHCPHFEWTAERSEDWKTAPNGWMSTRYESKGKDAGRCQTYLIYKRKPRKAPV